MKRRKRNSSKFYGIYIFFAECLLPVAAKGIVSSALGRLGIAHDDLLLPGAKSFGRSAATFSGTNTGTTWRKLILTRKPHPEASPWALSRSANGKTKANLAMERAPEAFRVAELGARWMLVRFVHEPTLLTLIRTGR